MKPILMLTDHRSHSSNESIYDLCKHFHQRGHKVYIASRGLKENRDFFYKCKSARIIAKPYNNNFTFNNMHSWFDGHEYIDAFIDTSCLMLRLDSPIDEVFLTFIDHNKQSPVINSPKGISTTRNRHFISKFPAYTPQSIYAHTIEEVQHFITQHESVIKRDDSFGGFGVHRFIGSDRLLKFEQLPTETLKQITSNIDVHGGVLVQEYLSRTHEGDKRILVSFGQPIGAFVRLPKEGDWLCNMSQGGSIESAQLNDDEISMVNEVDKVMTQHGIILYGIDTLVDNSGKRVISEFNVTNVGGFSKLTTDESISAYNLIVDNVISLIDKGTL